MDASNKPSRARRLEKSITLNLIRARNHVACPISELANVTILDLTPFFRAFFSSNPKSKTGANGFGSGFLVRFLGSHYLVSALHVVENALEHGTVVVNINGKGIVLENIGFFKDSDNDIAAAPIDEFLIRNGINSVPAVELDNENTSFEPIGYHLLMGYPGTKNKLDTRWNKTERKLYSIIAQICSEETDVNTDISDTVLFEFDTKALVDSNLKPAGKPPQLYEAEIGVSYCCIINSRHTPISWAASCNQASIYKKRLSRLTPRISK